MSKISRVIIYLLLLCNLAIAASGNLSGYIFDKKDGKPLMGANLQLVEINVGAASDEDGRFLIKNIPYGQYHLKASYIGYESIKIKVVINQSIESLDNIHLSPVVISSKEVVVSAQARGQLNANNQQLQSKSINNVVARDLIQSLPQANAAEAVGRVSGVSVLRSGGEANKIVIRGLSPEHNRISLEGVQMASTGGDRSTDISMISPYMLDGIEVTKAATPDKDADAIGGNVDFQFKEAGDSLLTADLVARGGYNELKKELGDYKLAGSLGQRFWNNQLGFLGHIDVEGRNRSSNSLSSSYKHKEGITPKLGENNPIVITKLNLADNLRNLDRLGISGVIDYKNDLTKIKLTNFYSKINTSTTGFSETFSFGESNVDQSFEGNYNEEEKTIIMHALKINQQVKAWNIDVAVSHSSSEAKIPESESWYFSENNVLTGSDVPDLTLSPEKLDNNLKNVNAVDGAELIGINTRKGFTKESMNTICLDMTRNFIFNTSINGYIKIGGKYRKKEKENNYEATTSGALFAASHANIKQAIASWLQENRETDFDKQGLAYSYFIKDNYDDNDFLAGDYTIGPVPDDAILRGLVNTNKIYNSFYNYAKGSILNDYNGKEAYSAVYVMLDLNLGKHIEIIPGIRYERNKTTYSGIRGLDPVGGAYSVYPHDTTTKVRNVEHILPMVHGLFSPADWCKIKLAYTNTLSRPAYTSIIPKQNIDNGGNISWNNFRLNPAQSENFDLNISFQQNKIGFISLGLFYKNIHELIYSYSEYIKKPEDYDLSEDMAGNKISTQLNNQYVAEDYGLELSWQTNFWYLPGFLKNIVFNINYTKIFSDTKYPYTEYYKVRKKVPGYPMPIFVSVDTTKFFNAPLLNQPDDIINMSIGYEYKGFSSRFSMNYQSKIFKSVDFWPEFRSDKDDYLKLDLVLKQDLPGNHMQLFFNWTNISAEVDQYLNRGNHYPTHISHYGATYDLGLRIKL